MRVIAHRGNGAQFPENTLAAVEAAISGGADGVEIDVRTSADGVALCCHDPDLRRVAGRDLTVARTDAARLCSLELGAGQHIPRLEDVLALALGRTQVVLDLKTDDGTPRHGSVASAVCRILRRLRSTDALVVSSFDPRALEHVAEHLPRVRRALITDGGVSASASLAETVARAHHDAHPHVDAVLAEPDIAVRAAERGVLVRAWTVNAPAAARQLAGKGVEGVITDHPALLGSSLTESGIRSQRAARRSL